MNLPREKLFLTFQS